MKRRSPKLETAKAFLRHTLAHPTPATAVIVCADWEGIGERTLIRAARSLGVRSLRSGGREWGAHWVWELPPPEGSQTASESA